MALLRRSAAPSDLEFAPPPPAAEPEPPRSPPDLLRALARSPLASDRRAAARDLGLSPESAGDLAAALGLEPDASVREAIVTSLVAIGSEEAAAGLSVHLASEDTGLRNAAIEALQQMGSTAAAQVGGLLGDPDADVRIFAVNALERLDDRLACAWLRDVLERDTEVNVGLAAVEALSRLGGPEDVPALRAFAARFADEPFAAFAVDLACRRMAGAGP